MSRILTFAEIKGKKVPSAKDFQEVSEYTYDAVRPGSAIVFALIFGSVVRGDANTRSDLDIAAVYDPDQEKEAIVVLQQIDQFAQRHNVSINYAVTDKQIARTRLHHVGPLFMDHLVTASASGGLLKGSLRVFTLSTREKSEFESYLSVNAYRLTAGFAKYTTMSARDRCRFLAKVFDIPFHVARKTLMVRGLLTAEDDGRSRAIEEYARFMPATLGETLANLEAWNEKYARELGSQLRKPDQASYRSMLNVIAKRGTSLALRFLRGNIEYSERNKG